MNSYLQTYITWDTNRLNLLIVSFKLTLLGILIRMGGTTDRDKAGLELGECVHGSVGSRILVSHHQHVVPSSPAGDRDRNLGSVMTEVLRYVHLYSNSTTLSLACSIYTI